MARIVGHNVPADSSTKRWSRARAHACAQPTADPRPTEKSTHRITLWQVSWVGVFCIFLQSRTHEIPTRYPPIDPQNPSNERVLSCHVSLPHLPVRVAPERAGDGSVVMAQSHWPQEPAWPPCQADRAVAASLRTYCGARSALGHQGGQCRVRCTSMLCSEKHDKNRLSSVRRQATPPLRLPQLEPMARRVQHVQLGVVAVQHCGSAAGLGQRRYVRRERQHASRAGARSPVLAVRPLTVVDSRASLANSLRGRGLPDATFQGGGAPMVV